MSQAKVKLLSAWFGPLPSYTDRFRDQWRHYQTVDWELVTPDLSTAAQLAWMQKRVREKLKSRCAKGGTGDGEACCDLRPFYGLLFPERYEGYDWWGWIDLDMVMGDVDRLLPPLLDGDHDVVTFKKRYLSGNFSLLRNTPEVCAMPLKSPEWRWVVAQPRYCGFDEIAHPPDPDRDNFRKLLERVGVKILQRDDLYGYDSPSELNGFRRQGDKVLASCNPWRPEWREVLFFHCMSDRWPIKDIRL